MRSHPYLRAALCAATLAASQMAFPSFAAEATASAPSAPELTGPQRDFMKWRFGMFIHFNLGTFVDNDWAGGYENPDLFSPSKLDCGQWADVAKEAGMTYLVLTVKHTEGIALYPSAVTTRNITM
ncbi:MAG TPA: alpha-L-fucosidase, partial [Opitutaceae bacterium]